MKRFGYSVFAACLSLGMGLSAAAGTANAAQPSLMAAPTTAPAQASAPTAQTVQYYDYRDDRRYWRYDRPRTGPITDMTGVTGVRVLPTVRHRLTAAATRIPAGATAAIGHTAPMTIRSNPITGRAASAIRLIYKAATNEKAPHCGAFLSIASKY
ncbi:(U62541) immunoreactive 14 kDa protein BA14k [Ochrobactrum soli]|uniref:(U62541) immunoreactive 14 kDa protein BA14k n=1 Tax=Ochrobactrum soli TaxID=2448455 RepID=A0A2P9HJR3_9HYPH|nr:(U62541) immunoreactive 14 kDa protein BA14k [[Ochrobactrum] soli]